MFSILGRVAIPIVVALFFALARRYLPTSANEVGGSAPAPEELSIRFSTTQWLVAAAMLVTGVALFFSLHWILVWANQYFASLDGPANFTFLPQSAIWFFLPGFASVTLTWEVTLWIWSRLGGGRSASLYEYWSNGKAGFNATRLLRIIILVVVLPIAALTVLALPEHDSLRSDEIRSHGYGISTTKVFRYSNATALVVIDGFRNRDGKLVKRAGCILYFKDGQKWSSAALGDFNARVDPMLVHFLEKKTGMRASFGATEAEIVGPR